MRDGEAGSVLSRLAERTVTVDAHSGFLWYWNVAVRAAPVSGQAAPTIAPVGHKKRHNASQDRGYGENGHDSHRCQV
jgi:hypothetical protein